MVGDQAMSQNIAIGVGCRLGCSADAIEALIHQALDRMPALVSGRLSRTTSPGLFSIADKQEEPGLAEAACRLGFDLTFLARAALCEQESRVRTRSAASRRRFAVPSVAEAAALAGAGPGAMLLVARLAQGGATCAIAVSPESWP